MSVTEGSGQLTDGWRRRPKKTQRRPIWCVLQFLRFPGLWTEPFLLQMREIAEIELAIQGGTEKIETLGTCSRHSCTLTLLTRFMTGEQGKVEESMREMAAIEALKSEKADKEVCFLLLWSWICSHRKCFVSSENYKF